MKMLIPQKVFPTLFCRFHLYDNDKALKFQKNMKTEEELTETIDKILAKAEEIGEDNLEYMELRCLFIYPLFDFRYIEYSEIPSMINYAIEDIEDALSKNIIKKTEG